MRRAQANLWACAGAAAATLAVAGCGGGERRDDGARTGTYTVDVERVSFLPRQRLAQRTALVIAVRNAGEETIPNLAVTVRGFARRAAGSDDAGLGRDLWIVDQAPAGAATAFEDTWSAGPLDPGRTARLRWEVTPVVAGTHVLTYEIVPAVVGRARLQLQSGERPRGSLTVRVRGEPSQARVDPRTGAVQRKE